MFGRNRDAAPAEAVDQVSGLDESDAKNPQAGKGRPTPTRKEAEAARKQALKAPRNSKEARKAERDRERALREERRQAMLRGEEDALPVRDQGPIKRFVRDFIDSRFWIAELFVPSAIVILVLSLVRNVEVQRLVSLAWVLFLALVVLDTFLLVFRTRRAVRKQFPDDPDATRGVSFYAALRAMQIRRLRLPPPKVRRGGAPVTPKQSKRTK